MSRALLTKTAGLPDLTPTSYAVLGLLALRPWTTYELAKQMQRSVRWFWPRAERKLYDEPKHLAARGLADARSVMTGKRAGTVYEITPEGRDALQRWAATTDAAPPLIEMESIVRVFFAEHGTPEQLVTLLQTIGTEARNALAELHAVGSASADGTDPFPDRRALNAVVLELIVRLHETIDEWSSWAVAEVEQWPPERRGRRRVAMGPRARGSELFAAIGRRTGKVSDV